MCRKETKSANSGSEIGSDQNNVKRVTEKLRVSWEEVTNSMFTL